MKRELLALLMLCSVAGFAQGNGGLIDKTTYKQQLGKLLFFDTNLSEPKGQSCATCHQPQVGFNGNGNPNAAVIAGAVPTRFGNRNPPSAAYAFASPKPQYYTVDGEVLFMGGQFWDGRAANLAEQAKAPFLNPVEMNNPSKAAVVQKACNSFVLMFRYVYGPQSCAPGQTDATYDAIADAIAAFESGPEVNRFSSKYDLYLAGKAQLSQKEKRGLELFEGKALCAQCHPSGAGSPFTDFSYDNIGIPKNPNNPFYATDPSFVDLGLGARLGPAENGRFKVSSLRNIAISPPYGHNGYFKTLEDVVHFYNTRDTDKKWPKPEVMANLNVDELGHLGLTPAEEDAIVAFLKTLTDQ